MPLVNGGDSHGRFWKWGSRGHKYYYPAGNPTKRMAAKKLAIKQAVAINYSKMRSNGRAEPIRRRARR